MKKSIFFFSFIFLFFVSCDTVFTDLDSSVNTEITTDYLLVEGDLTTYMGDMEVVRLKGKPGVTVFDIGTGDADLGDYEPCFILYIATGEESVGTVSSAIIKFDGVEILNTSDFSGDVYKEYKFEICNLNVLSTLEVEIRGEPGSELDIWINGKPSGGDPFAGDEGTFTDRGIVYNWVRIGTQIWMAENLAYNAGAGCWAYDNEPNNVDTYGRLYTWDAAVANCPEGWHLPNDDEWYELASFIDSEQGNLTYFPDGWQVASYLKAESGWDYSGNGTDDYGFSALPGGFRSSYAHETEFDMIGIAGCWWSSTITAYPGDRRYWWLDSYQTTLNRSSRVIATGQSVRCILDTP